jgi:hypothetical protein
MLARVIADLAAGRFADIQPGGIAAFITERYSDRGFPDSQKWTTGTVLIGLNSPSCNPPDGMSAFFTDAFSRSN